VAEEVKVVGNPDRLAQVFVNLLRNAMNAFEGHEVASRQVEVRTRALRRGGREGLAIAVEDNGPGIPPEVLPEIFDAFVTTRLDAYGTGLGLTVAQGIVTQHGGAITASNRKEGGARLEVWLPAGNA
jgi:signal transduction histidine kinase